MGLRFKAGAFAILAAISVAPITLTAQIGYPGGQYPGGGPYPGGSPYPTGQPGGGGGRYPGGRNPNGNGNPNGTGNGAPRRGSKNAPAVIPTSTLGMLRVVAGGQLVLEADDHRIITYATNNQTKIDKEGKTVELTAFSPGDHLTVDSTADEKGFMTAVGVTFNSAGSARDRADAARTWDLPDIRTQAKQRGADDDRPVLRRNKGADDNGDDGPPVLRRENGGGNSKDSQASAGNAPKPPVPDKTASNQGPASQAPDPADDQASNTPPTVLRPNDPPPDADDPGRPELHRGKPAQRARAASDDIPDSDAPPARTASTRSPLPPPAQQAPSPSRESSAPSLSSQRAAADVIPVQQDPVIVKAREAAASYAATLPNYLCKENITRYESDNPKRGWDALDVISADLAVENGNESHKNIKIGTKATNKPMEEVGGSWSTGQFAGTLEDLFSPNTNTSFRKSGQETISGRPAFIFSYDVKREDSHWRVITASQLYYPAFRGRIWIDKQSYQILRIEMESRNIPPMFPLAKVESATDYGYIRLATANEYLLPMSAEVLSCESGSSRCARNRIEYRNYHKFGAESDILFDDKQ